MGRTSRTPTPAGGSRRKLRGPVAQSAARFWLPRIHMTGVPTPRTRVVSVDAGAMMEYLRNPGCPSVIDDMVAELVQAGDDFGWPLFIRSDYTAAYHRWQDTCYVSSEEHLPLNIRAIYEECVLRGYPIYNLYAREFLLLDSYESDRDGRPYGREYRIGIRDGQVESFSRARDNDLLWTNNTAATINNIERLATIPPHERDYIVNLAIRACQNLFGNWLIDVAKLVDGGWAVIDAERGDLGSAIF